MFPSGTLTYKGRLRRKTLTFALPRTTDAMRTSSTRSGDFPAVAVAKLRNALDSLGFDFRLSYTLRCIKETSAPESTNARYFCLLNLRRSEFDATLLELIKTVFLFCLCTCTCLLLPPSASTCGKELRLKLHSPFSYNKSMLVCCDSDQPP